MPAEDLVASEASACKGRNPCADSSVDPFAAHPSSQEVDAKVLLDPINIGHITSQTGMAHSVSAPSVFREAPETSLSGETPSQTGVSGGSQPPTFKSDLSDSQSSSQTGVCDGSQPSTVESTGTAAPPPSFSSSPRKPSLSCMQGPQFSPVFQPSAERCSALLHALQSAPWPANSSARQSVSMTSQGPSGYDNFGVQISDRSSLTAVTRLLPQLLQVINAFLSEVWPAGTWNAVCVGRNTTARAHRDLANTPGSMNLALSVGEFAGGQLWVEDVNGDTPVCLPDGVLLDGSLHNTHNAPFLFPCEKWHQTFPFQGERWVLAAYHMPGVAHHVITGSSAAGQRFCPALPRRQATPSSPLTGATISTSRMCERCAWICDKHLLGHS